MAELEHSIAVLERLLGVAITIIDRNFIWSRADSPFPSMRRSHRKNRICDSGFCHQCVAHCRYDVAKKLSTNPHPFISECWKGGQELVIPLLDKGIYCGAMFVGIWRKPNFVPPHGLPQDFYTEYEKTPIFSHRYIDEITPMLEIFAAGLVTQLEQANQLQKWLSPREEQIVRFINSNLAEPLQLDDLAKELQLSTSRTTVVVKDIFGENFSNLVRQIRLKNVDFLLQFTQLNLEEIAKQSGFSSPFYLSKIYKLERNITPGQFRKNSLVFK